MMVGTRLLLLLLAPVIAQAALPEPLHQRDPWTPPKTRIPAHIVQAAGVLFDAGLADPRGGDYRHITLLGTGHEGVRTHGWVFEDRYAVCWNGLVYNVVTLGERADLARDVQAIAEDRPWHDRLIEREAPNPNVAFLRHIRLTDHGDRMLPITLLLRLGRADLAERIWSDGNTDLTGYATTFDWISYSAITWLGKAFHRVVEERERGDDAGAADVAESMMRWERRLREVWITAPPPDNHSLAAANRDLQFLQHTSALLSDSQRRLGAPSRPPLPAGLQSSIREAQEEATKEFRRRPQSERIADLVDRLDDVAAKKMVWPGPLAFLMEPICYWLEREGEAAVLALIDAIEHDKRLTRTVDFSRPWSINGTPIPVAQAARETLGRILRNSALVEKSTPAELRLWWEQHRAMTPAERNFAVLAGDARSAQEWLDSAAQITDRTCVRGKPPSPMAGEHLRDRQNPSVAELLARRTGVLAASGRAEEACRMAFEAYLWEPNAAALPALQAAGKLRCHFEERIAGARIHLGDLQAARELELTIQDGRSLRGRLVQALFPLWMFRDDPAIVALAERLVTRVDPPLEPETFLEFASSPLLTVPAVRRLVLEKLRDDAEAGSATGTENGDFSIKIGTKTTWVSGEPSDITLKPGERISVRIKDALAWELGRIEGFPRFNLAWPESRKDSAAAEIAGLLGTHSANLRVYPSNPSELGCFGELISLALTPRL